MASATQESTPTPDYTIGQFDLKTNDTYTFFCDALAFSRRQSLNVLQVVSVVGSHTAVKALGATLQSNARAEFHPTDIPNIASFINLDKHDRGYRVYRQQLGYGKWHLLAIANDAGLMPLYNSQSLWNLLHGRGYTTPLLPGWIPWLAKRLKGSLDDRELLEQPRSFQCQPVVLCASNDDLDRLVIEGRDAGQLQFTPDMEIAPW